MHYVARNQAPIDHLKVGATVSVPDWWQGKVVGWTNGVITEIRRSMLGNGHLGDTYVIVRLESTDEEAGYYPYSIAPKDQGNTQ